MRDPMGAAFGRPPFNKSGRWGQLNANIYTERERERERDWNKERYLNKPRLRMQNCQGFELTGDPSASPNRFQNPRKIGQICQNASKIKPVGLIIFDAF